MLQNPRIETTPQRQPGICISCGAASSSPRKWFLDTDCDNPEIPNWAIIFCDLCFDILANHAHYILIDEGIKSLKDRIKGLEEELNELSHIRAYLDRLGIDYNNLRHLADLSEMGIVEPSEITGPVSARTAGFAESSDGEELDRVRSSDNLSIDLGI